MIIKKTILIIFSMENDKNLSKEKRFSKKDINVINLEFKNVLIEQKEEYLAFIKNQEKSIIERNLGQ